MSLYANNGKEKPIFLTLWENKGLVFLAILVAVGVSTAATYFAKPVWEAKTTIVFPTQIPSVLGSEGFAKDSGIIASLAGSPTPLKVYKGFMESERTINYVAARTGLKRTEILKRRVVRDQPMESSLSVTFRDTDLQKAIQTVALHLESLEAINEDVARPLMADDSSVLERKVAEQRAIVSNLEQRLLQFQNNAETAPTVSVSSTTGGSMVVADPAKWRLQQRELEIELRKINSSLKSATDTVTSAAISDESLPTHIPPARKWRDRLVELEYELKIKEIEYAPGSPEISRLQEEISATRTQLQKEVGAYIQAVQEKSIDPTSPSAEVPVLLTRKVGLQAQLSAVRKLANLAPEESIALSAIVRDLGTQTSVLQKVEQQYELARIQSERDPSRWQILDPPAVGDKPINKSYTKNGAGGLLFGLMIGGLLAVRRQSNRADEVVIDLRKAA